MWTDGGECFCPQRVFWAVLHMLWVQFLLKEKGRVGILTRWPVASVHGVLLSSAAGFVPGCSLQKSKQHFRGTHHPCDGADGYLALGRVPKGSGGPKRAGALKRKLHRWLHSDHGQIKGHGGSHHLKGIFVVKRSPPEPFRSPRTR